MPHVLRPAALAVLLLAACADETETDASAEAPVAAETAAPAGPAAIQSSITLGTFEGTVSDLAFYEAPAFGFLGAVVAANGAAGIAVIRVDNGSAASWTTESITSRLDVTYAIDADAGSVLTLSSDGTLAAYSLSGELLTSIDVPGTSPEDICTSDDLAAVLVDGDIQIVEVGTDDDGQANLTLGPVIETGGIDGCDGIGAGLVFAGDEAQLILNAEGNLEATGQPIEAMPVISSGGTAVGVTANNGLLRVGSTSLLVETADNAPILPRLVEATGGNYGGVLRDGAIAVLDENNTLHLVPWSGAASAAGLEAVSDSKRPADVFLPDVIDIPTTLEGAEDLTPSLDGPTFDDVDLPEPPGR